jgi:hypothetical protein
MSGSMSGMWKRSHGEPLRHRQTKGAATDMFYLTPPRHISTLTVVQVKSNSNMECARQAAQRLPEFTEDTDAPQRIT